MYYHLQEYNESMVLALGAGKLFKLDNGGEYEETIIGKPIADDSIRDCVANISILF